VTEQHLPKQRSTYRMGPPLSGRAQASSADTSAMGRHLRGASEGGEGGVGESVGIELGMRSGREMALRVNTGLRVSGLLGAHHSQGIMRRPMQP